MNWYNQVGIVEMDLIISYQTPITHPEVDLRKLGDSRATSEKTTLITYKFWIKAP